MITRKAYLLKIRPFLNKPIIKVLTGMRRVGKSTLLLQLRQELLDQGISENNILLINKDSLEWDFIKTYLDLNLYVQKQFSNTKERCYVLVDEIQEITSWEKAVNSFLLQRNLDVLITGSNAHLLSAELSTLLTGRFIEIPVLPLSFSEFFEFRKYHKDLRTPQELLPLYLRYGGLPGIHDLPLQDEQIFSYLNAILNTILLRDIVKRHNIRDIAHLERILSFVFDNCGNLVSARSIANYFKNQQTKITSDTVLNYLGFLKDAYLIFKVGRYELKGKKHLEFQDKYYLGDLGLRHALFGYRENDIGGLLENLVYLELLRRGYQVHIGVLDQIEIDFVAEKNADRLYIQVAYLLSDQETRTREFGNLEKIADNYPKILLSLDPITFSNSKGIKHQNLIEFLLQST